MQVHPDLDLIIFDCDGVLVDSEPIALRISADMTAELGWHLTDEQIVQLFVGRSEAENLVQIEDHIGRSVPADWPTRFADRVRAAHELDLAAVEGILEALAAIAETGIPTCVASSGGPERIRHSLSRVGMLDQFAGHIFSAAQVAHGKPAPDLFLLAAHTMGADPARCLVVEDSRYGVIAARAAGMRALGYAGGVTPAEWLEGADTVVFSDMRKLPELIAAAASGSETGAESSGAESSGR
jgi:HAD superfamily hydrolase (TIGR01509 family)